MKGMPVLNAFPEIKQLGVERLQQLCDEFRESYVGREFAISRIDVQSRDGELGLSFVCKPTHEIKPREEYYFPMDELLRFIAENGIADEAERKIVHCRIQTARQKGGPNVYRRFVFNPGPKLPLFLTCKNPACGNLMLTDLMAYRNQRYEFDSIDPITCMRCNHVSHFTDRDLHFGPNT